MKMSNSRWSCLLHPQKGNLCAHSSATNLEKTKAKCCTKHPLSSKNEPARRDTSTFKTFKCIYWHPILSPLVYVIFLPLFYTWLQKNNPKVTLSLPKSTYGWATAFSPRNWEHYQQVILYQWDLHSSSLASWSKEPGLHPPYFVLIVVWSN